MIIYSFGSGIWTADIRLEYPVVFILESQFCDESPAHLFIVQWHVTRPQEQPTSRIRPIEFSFSHLMRCF